MRQNKKIGDIQEDLILVAAIGVGAYLLLTKLPDLVPDFLKGGSTAAQNTVQSINTLDQNSNPFNINYEYSLYASSPSAYGQAFYKNLLNTFFDPNNQGSGGTFNIANWAETILNAMGTVIEQDSVVDGVFNVLTSQADVSNIAAYLYFNYQIDLLNLLTNGRGIIPLVNKGLSTDHLAQIINHVNSLPVK